MKKDNSHPVLVGEWTDMNTLEKAVYKYGRLKDVCQKHVLGLTPGICELSYVADVIKDFFFKFTYF